MILQSTRVWIAEQWSRAQVEIVNGKIERIHAYGSQAIDLDYGNLRVLPGFIDTHIHGSHGEDTNLCSEEGLIRFANTLLQEGVTGFCPTTVTQSEAVLLRALNTVAKVHQTQTQGSQILGIHFEGPYLNVKYKGAQPEQFIIPSNVEQFKKYELASNNLIKIITLAPENDEAYALCRYASSKGITVNIGHSAATYEQTWMAIANGAKSMTHAFNAMSPLNHREPGVAGAMLQLGSVYAEVISDGNHVVWPVINLLFKVKGKDHVIMITDALSAKGMPEGLFDLGGQMVDIRSNKSAYIHQTDTLAGSTLSTNIGLKNLIEKARVDEIAAINSCTINPAKVIGYAQQKGLIQVNYDADLVVLQDDYQVEATYIKGQKVYQG
jgi:N-acetylglucosamine-6-phosphate deacetylase